MKAKSWSGDLTGGVVASIMSLPDAMAYGVLIFSALDPSLAADTYFGGELVETGLQLRYELPVSALPIIVTAAALEGEPGTCT